MEMTAPRTKFNELIKQLNDMRQSGKIDEFTLRLVYKEAEKLKETDLAEGFSIMGVIECLRGNTAEMHRLHKLSLDYSSEALFYINYAMSLHKSGLVEDAHQMIVQAYGANPTDLDLLQCAIEGAVELERTEEAAVYMKSWEKLTGEEFRVFPEDDEEVMFRLFEVFDKMVEEHPELVVKPDEDFMAMIGELVEGVEVD